MFRRVVRLIARSLQVAWPFILRALRMTAFLATTSLASIAVGVPAAVTRIADNWESEASAAGLPVSYQPVLRRAAIVIAVITLLLGWLILASLTTLALRTIF